MSTSVNNEDNLTSDAIHNRNCYTYFLQLKPVIQTQRQFLTKLLPEFARLHTVMEQEYDENYPYGNLYSSCIAALEEFIDRNSTENIKDLDDLVLAIYHNDNKILEESSAWINGIDSEIRPRQSNTEKKIQNKIKDTKRNVNRQSPNDSGGIYRRLYSLFANNFKPQYETNLPTIKNFSYKKSSDATEYRFSTQAQRHEGQTRVSPLFRRWLQINAQKSDPNQSICHIYFNNLALDRSDYDIAGSKERDLTLELHKLENDPSLKTLVITLPANEGLMDSSDYEITHNRLSSRSVFNEFLDIAREKADKKIISDFRISPIARELLFGPENEEIILKKLLMKSFLAQGLAHKRFISSAEKQAVWVHFIKYELTDYILKTIKPKSFNFSCKDAIDRGALSSTYYNLIQSFNLEQPIKKEEFERSLDAPAANVKGRGMNFHRKIIWNALNTYVNANYSQLITHEKKSWLIYWRDMNCPKIRTEELLKNRLKQTIQQFHALPKEKNDIKTTGLHLLNTVKELHTQKASGKRLLLEVVSRTSELLHASSEESIEKYKRLANELKINHPSLYIIGGIMEVLLGFILYLPSLGYSEKLIDHGSAAINTGFFSYRRTELSDEMIHITSVLAPLEV
ncbi:MULTISPECIES: hypothetical protein [Legionella]|uniref:Uncharacterized protein n=1 Tax=Legionella resiliens TaxID=2905958 RepID=A0ABS8X4U6_9GAMM|nr:MULTISPECIES: hypothetical protein [unclassified Legionella]MCE0723832.1 hypothetical protein [Legionella sp. 9fVS26]MCE3532984.1 hypothetical protein [Legionella sp. 8cVS16]QLZ69175.1 hypothetical protein FOLKNPGA_01957 [Legionella sp. PC1000]